MLQEKTTSVNIGPHMSRCFCYLPGQREVCHLLIPFHHKVPVPRNVKTCPIGNAKEPHRSSNFALKDE